LSRNPKPNKKAVNAIDRFHNPNSHNIKLLYKDVLRVPDITIAWWGNPTDKTGQSPADFLSTTVHLAVRTDEHVASQFP
jgi:hypothetical protein